MKCSSYVEARVRVIGNFDTIGKESKNLGNQGTESDCKSPKTAL